MYGPRAFVVDDLAVLHKVIRERVFVTFAAILGERVAFAYAPVILDDSEGSFGTLGFHFAIGNPLAALKDGARLSLSIMAADAYVSPDWYKQTVTVPTWNYIALEGEGSVRRSSREELRQLVIDLSAQEEEKLRPKETWLIDKVPPQRVEALLNGIVAFSLPLDRLDGKFKLSQDKTPDDVAGVIAGLEARGDPASLAISKAMRARATAP
jgi:transcriptional regulator